MNRNTTNNLDEFILQSDIPACEECNDTGYTTDNDGLDCACWVCSKGAKAYARECAIDREMLREVEDHEREDLAIEAHKDNALELATEPTETENINKMPLTNGEITLLYIWDFYHQNPQQTAHAKQVKRITVQPKRLTAEERLARKEERARIKQVQKENAGKLSNRGSAYQNEMSHKHSKGQIL